MAFGSRRLTKNGQTTMECIEFLMRIGAKEKAMAYFFVENLGTGTLISKNCAKMQVHDDTWLIALEGSRLRLYHNNYHIRKDYSRKILDQDEPASPWL